MFLPKSLWQCRSIPLATAMLFANGCLFGASAAGNGAWSGAAPVVKKWPQPTRETIPAGTLPFTAADLALYFKDALAMEPAHSSSGTVIFEDRNATRKEDAYRIVISPKVRDLIVAFTVSGDHGMNLAREFFEAPLFDREESERFYALLNLANTSPSERLRRFTVTISLQEFPDSLLLTLRFSPNPPLAFQPDSRPAEGWHPRR